jgi:hypothetical protein
MEQIAQIKASAQETIEKLRKVSKIDFGYNKESVRWLEGYIERLRQNGSFSDSKDQFVGVFGSYLGECIIHCYGGHWENRDVGFAITFDKQNWVLPFNRISKQWENGLTDGIGGFFELIPMVYSKQIKAPSLAAKPRWKFW